MITMRVVIEYFIDPADAAILVKEMSQPSEVNPYPSYYKTRFGGTGYPYNKTVLDIQKKYSLLSNEVHQRLNQVLSSLLLCTSSFLSKYNGHGIRICKQQQQHDEIISVSSSDVKMCRRPLPRGSACYTDTSDYFYFHAAIISA